MNPQSNDQELPTTLIEEYDDFPMLDAFKIRILFGPAVSNLIQGVFLLTKGVFVFEGKEHEYGFAVWVEKPRYSRK